MIFEKQILAMYKGMAYTRCDDNGTAYYFSAKDFPSLKFEAFEFPSSLGHNLSGKIYYYGEMRCDRIIVFDHGFGGGHLSYMKEIEILCKNGYTVVAYDHTGCMESGGENPNGMAQSLCDLNDCITAVRADARFENSDISVMGHSWGGFSTLNIVALHPDISHIVVLSGFVSVKMLIDSYFGGIMKGYRSAIMRLEREANPRFVEFSAVESLKNSKAKALLIYSDNDMMCRKNPHYDALTAALSDKENVRFMLVSGKGHNPNYTRAAVEYLGEYTKRRAKLLKKGALTNAEDRERFVSSFDWNRMTEQDEQVWSEILAHLEN